MKEIWKNIPGYEGLYQASNLGRIKSLERIIQHNGAYGGFYHIKEKILKQNINKWGYLGVFLSKEDHTRKRYSVHRLVMITFNDNKDRSLDINHIDGDKTNNRLDNLEWCTREYNSRHAVKIGLNKQAIKIKAIKGNNIVIANSINSLYYEIIKKENIDKSWKTFTEGVRRSIKTNKTYCGYKFICEK